LPILWILATIGLGLLVDYASILANVWIVRRMGMERTLAMPWIALDVNHLALLVAALIVIAILSRGRFSEYGLRRPRAKSYIWSAIAWGVFFGVLMTVIDYLPQILSRRAPGDLPLTTASLTGWLTFEWLFVGFGEEIAFRGLLQTFLMKRSSGRIRLFKYEMHVAGVILALLFALAHAANFGARPFWIAMGQQIYAFALGILYAYWYEKSGSLIAPIIGHNIGDGVEYALMFLMVWRWH